MTGLRPLMGAALLALAPVTALADGPEVHDAFAILSPAGQSGAAFMRLENPGPDADRLVAASAEISQRVELHTHIEDDAGVMRMVEVEEGFALPAGGSVLLERGGDHVMFLGLTEAPEVGETIDLTLVFEVAGPITVAVEVVAPSMDQGHGHSHNHGHSHGHSHGNRP